MNVLKIYTAPFDVINIFILRIVVTKSEPFRYNEGIFVNSVPSCYFCEKYKK